jgi:hypothetical protein
MIRMLVIVLGVLLTAAPALADEVLYCVDTDSGGFAWDKSGVASLRKFTTTRYTVKLEPATEHGDQVRVITRTIGGVPGGPTRYMCAANLLGAVDAQVIPQMSKSPLVCNEPTGTEPFIFFPGNTYTHAFLQGGPPGSGHDPNIWIDYGVCTPF